MTPVTLTIRWEELFGKTQADMPDDVRRTRWEEWKALCAKQPDGKEVVERWTTCDDTCLGCVYRQGDWCASQSLPCTVNPVLTFKMNFEGMACMGTGYKPGQMNMF